MRKTNLGNLTVHVLKTWTVAHGKEDGENRDSVEWMWVNWKTDFVAYEVKIFHSVKFFHRRIIDLYSHSETRKKTYKLAKIGISEYSVNPVFKKRKDYIS